MAFDAVAERIRRKQLFVDAVRGIKKPEHVPLVSNYWTWKILDSGYKFSEALLNYDNLFKINCEHHEKYNFDSYLDPGIGPLYRVTPAFGQSIYVMEDEPPSLNYIEPSFFLDSDYEILHKKGWERFLWEDYVPRKYHYSSLAMAKEKIYAGMKEFVKAQAHIKRTMEQFQDVYGIPFYAQGRYWAAVESMISGLMGIKGLCIAMRRYPEKFETALRDLLPFTSGDFPNAVKNSVPSDRTIFDFRMPLLAHNVMSNKQFERFYWPYLKEWIDGIVANDKIGYLNVEGSADNIMEYLQEIPKGHIAVLFEDSDIFEAKKKLGDRVAIMGGYPTRLLNDGTPEECIAFCKRILEEVGYDGSYIYCAAKMISFKNDSNPKNVLAVNDFFRSAKL